MKNLKTIVSSLLIAVSFNGINAHNPHSDEIQFDLSTIEYIEEEDFDLGFNTSDYLPEDFDPHTYYFNMDSITYVEEEFVLIDSEKNLPTDFNAYANPTNIEGINFMEEDVVDLGFDTAAYLPEGFDPHEFYFDLDSVEYIEEEEELDFNTAQYLPAGFNSL